MLEPHCQPYFMLQKIPINNITVQVIITWLGVLLYYDCNNDEHKQHKHLGSAETLTLITLCHAKLPATCHI